MNKYIPLYCRYLFQQYYCTSSPSYLTIIVIQYIVIYWQCIAATPVKPKLPTEAVVFGRARRAARPISPPSVRRKKSLLIVLLLISCIIIILFIIRHHHHHHQQQ